MPRREIAPAAFLAGVPLFKELDAATLARLAAATRRRTLRRGEVVFDKGDAATGMYVVVYGTIELVSSTPSRGERLTGLATAGQSFGEPVMFLEKAAMVQARAAADSLLLHLPKEAVFAEIESSPRFARRMIAGLSRRVENLVRELERQSLGSGRQRLMAYLLRQGNGEAGPIVVRLPAAKAQIASQLNLTPEHFSRILRDLADAGMLSVEGRTITVPNAKRLETAARLAAREAR